MVNYHLKLIIDIEVLLLFVCGEKENPRLMIFFNGTKQQNDHLRVIDIFLILIFKFLLVCRKKYLFFQIQILNPMAAPVNSVFFLLQDH